MDEKRKINLPCDLITVQLKNIAQRMGFIESLHTDLDQDGLYGPAIEESVREATRNTLEDVRIVFKELDAHTTIRSSMDKEELEWLCPEPEGAEA